MNRQTIQAITNFIQAERVDENAIYVSVHFHPDGTIYFVGATKHHTNEGTEPSVVDHEGAYNIHHNHCYPKPVALEGFYETEVSP